jgi:hypothetical protein
LSKNNKNIYYDFLNILKLFLSFLEQKRSIDWIYYEILAFCFHLEISNEDLIEIEKAKKELNSF